MSAQTGGRDGQKQDGKENLQGRTDFVEEEATLKQPGLPDDSMGNHHVLYGRRFSISPFTATGAGEILICDVISGCISCLFIFIPPLATCV